MSTRDHARAIRDAVEAGDAQAVADFVAAVCHAEDAYHSTPVDGDAARYQFGMTFLRAMAVGQPVATA